MFSFFKKKKKEIILPPIDAKLIGVDMHSHLIAGIDDGAQTLDDSVVLVKGLKEFGFQSFYTTPHVMSDFYRNSTKDILKGASELNSRLESENLNTIIQPSAEYYFDENFAKLVNDNDLLPIKNEYILFEFSYLNEPENPFGLIHKIRDLGYKPVLAHPERYPFYFGREEALRNVREHGVYFQLNVNSLAGHYGAQSLHAAHWMIEEGFADFLGTDIHKAAHLPIIERALCTEHMHRLVESGRLLNSQLS
ncbi:MAG: tyrosine-protein phosphatase [Flavobacteriales bacterium]